MDAIILDVSLVSFIVLVISLMVIPERRVAVAVPETAAAS